MKEEIHHIDEARTDEGIDNATVIEHARHACDQAEAGHLDFIKAGQSNTPGIPDDLAEAAANLPPGDTLRWFTTREIPAQAAAE